MITDPQPTLLCFFLLITFFVLHVKCHTWHGTHDKRHMKREMWGKVNLLFKNFSFLAFWVWEWRCSEDIFTKDDWLNEWMNCKGVLRTVPATADLVIICMVMCVKLTIFLIISVNEYQRAEWLPVKVFPLILPGSCWKSSEGLWSLQQ